MSYKGEVLSDLYVNYRHMKKLGFEAWLTSVWGLVSTTSLAALLVFEVVLEVAFRAT